MVENDENGRHIRGNGPERWTLTLEDLSVKIYKNKLLAISAQI
jgi:hypothetical protein